jgi:hypothetical protein
LCGAVGCGVTFGLFFDPSGRPRLGGSGSMPAGGVLENR